MAVTAAGSGAPSASWTVEVDGSTTEVSSAAGWLDLDPDASGTITLDDGSTLTFTGIERIEW